MAFLVSAAIGGGVAQRLSSGGFDDPSAESSRVQEVLRDQFHAGTPNTLTRDTVYGNTAGTTAKLNFTGSVGGGKAIEGLYNVNEIPVPYRDNPGNTKLLNEWMDAYKARTNIDAETGAVMGWFVMDMFVKTLEKTGPNLTTDNFIKALEASAFPRTFLGTPDISFGPKKHLGNSQARIAQAQNGRWVNVTDFVK